MDKARARRIMERHELDVLIGTARENIEYVSGLAGVDRRGSNRLERMFVLFPRDAHKDTILVIPRTYLLWVVQQAYRGSSLRTFGSYHYVLADERALCDEERELVALRDRLIEHASPSEALAAAIADLGLGERPTVGIDETQMTFGEWTRLHQVVPNARMVEAYSVFREIRMVKTAAEVARLRRVAEVNERAMLDAVELIREGVEQRVIQDRLKTGMVGAGATVNTPMIGFGWRSNYAHVEPSSYRAKAGDIFKFDHGCSLDGYAADTARSGVIGTPSSRQRDRFAAVLEAQQLGIQKARPGMLASDLFNVMIESLRKGLKNSTFQRSNLGHNIGRDTYDAPTIAAGDHTVLEAGMVLNIEAPDHELGFGGLTVEDTVLLKDDEVEYLTHASRELIIR